MADIKNAPKPNPAAEQSKQTAMTAPEIVEPDQDEAPAGKKLMKFRLVSGLSQGRDYMAPKMENGRHPPKEFRDKDMKGFKPGDDIVYSYQDLEKLHGKTKFERLDK